MHIGLDATAIPKNRAGAGNYIFNLVRGLAEVDFDNRYTIFAKSDQISDFGVINPGMEFVPVDMSRRSVRLAWEQTGLPQAVRKRDLDLLHSPHYTMPVVKPSKSVVTFCDTTFQLYPEMHSRAKRVFFPAMMNWSAKHADRLIAISDSTRNDVIRLLGVAPDKIVSIPLAASAAFRTLTTELVQSVCEKYVVSRGRFIYYVGVLEPRKNVPLLIEAYARIQPILGDVPLLIAGKKGWMYEAIFERVAQLGLQDHIRFLGYVPQDELIALYNAAGVFVYPSNYEGFGLPVLEAMQCGAPVVTTTASSLPEVAGDAALLVPPQDVEALAEAIHRILTNTQLASDLSKRGLEQSKQFSWQRCALETIQVYRSLS